MGNDASSGELILRFVGDPRNLEQVLTKVRADLSKTGQAQVTVARESNTKVSSEARNLSRTLEQEERARARASESLQKQKSAALIAQWKKEAQEKARIEKEKADAEKSSGGGFANIANQIPALNSFTSQLGALTTTAEGAGAGMAAAAAGVAIFVAGAVVGIGVLAKLGETIFDTAKKTAEYEGKFRDLSQQVGVSVETLSTLGNIAENTGGNIDTVSGSLGIFQRGLENAHDPTSKEAKLLGELGVTSLDTEAALRQTLKGLFALGETTKQTDAVYTLFGKSGRFVNAILKESHGDIDEAARRFGGLSQVTTQAAILGDDFNDSYNDLNRTLSGITRALVSDTIPVFTVFFKQINAALTGNADDWSFWRELITAEVSGVIATVQTAAQILSVAFVNIGAALLIDPLALLKTNIDRLGKEAERARNEARFQADVEKLQRLTQSILAGKPGDRPEGDADKQRSEAMARAAKLVQIHQRDLEESTRNNTERLTRERDLDLKSIDEWENESISAASDHLFAQLKIYDEELANARRFVSGRENLLLAETEIQQKRSKVINDTVKEIDKFKEEAQKRRDKAELDLNAQLIKVRDAQRDEEMRQIRADLDAGLISESEAIRRRTEVEKQGVADRNIHRQLEMDQATVSAARQIQLTNEKIEAEQQWTTRFLELTDQRIAALLREAQAIAETTGQKEFPAQSPQQVQRDAGRAANESAGEPPRMRATTRALVELATETGDVFDGLGTVIQNTFGLGAEAAQTFGNLISDVFGNVASAVGSAVQAFVLFGSVQGGFKKFAAEVIASVAQMAVVQSVFELAQGLAMLALTWFTGNPKYAQSAGAHFAAAAAFGIIGGVATVAGRAVAGNSFSQQGGGAGGSSSGGAGSGSGSGNTATSRTQPAPVELSRATRPPATTNVTIIIKRDPGSIVEAVVQNHRSNGEIRQMIQKEIKR